MNILALKISFFLFENTTSSVIIHYFFLYFFQARKRKPILRCTELIGRASRYILISRYHLMISWYDLMAKDHGIIAWLRKPAVFWRMKKRNASNEVLYICL